MVSQTRMTAVLPIMWFEITHSIYLRTKLLAKTGFTLILEGIQNLQSVNSWIHLLPEPGD